MKTTDFLKKYSTIDNQFIDDMYSFYDDSKNEYDFSIDLDKMAKWLEVKKEHLKRLLEANFSENQDYIQTKPITKLSGIGKNNIKIVLLTYECSKLLTMISRCEKANIIRKYYIDLEKLLIRYKDEIVENLNAKLGIKLKNKSIISKNKKQMLIYVLKVGDNIYKLGKTSNIENRMKQYKVGHIDESEIVFIYKTNSADIVEKCAKLNLKNYQYINDTELFNIDKEFMINTIKYCQITREKLTDKPYKFKKDQKWIVIFENVENDKKSLKKLTNKKKNTL
jgi:phage anti-repressor protein